MTNLRAGIRSLLNTPAFSTVAILTLAVGIAANAALFSVYDRLVLSFVSVETPATLVSISSLNPQINFNQPAVSWPRFVELQRSARSLVSVGLSAFDSFSLTGVGDQPDQLNGLRVSGAFFATLGIQPARGRDFRAEDDVPNGPLVCILSDSLWSTRFGRREAIVGEMIQLNGQSWQVIGVMPPITAPFRQAQVFAPRVFEVTNLSAAQVDVGAGYAQPIGRLAHGVTLAQAASELEAISRAYQKAFPAKLDANNLSVPVDFVQSIVGGLKPTLYTLLGAVGFVLLIACANVSSLFVARLSNRQREIAVRQSLGATRGAIARQFLTESLIFSVVAGLVGALLASFAISAITGLTSGVLPPNTVFSLNWRAWAFIAGVALVSAVFVGLIPALNASKAEIVETLKDAVRGSSSGRGGRLRASLIIGEVALSVVLLIGSGLLLLSFLSLQRTSPGFDPTGVATAFVSVPTSGQYASPSAQSDFYARVVEALRADPRITNASASLGLPLPGFGARAPYSVIGRPILPLPQRPLASLQIVSEDYFATLRIPVVLGRAFTKDDREGAPLVCAINQTLAAHLFPGEPAIGHVLARARDADQLHTIVGVIGDVRTNGVAVSAPDEVYYPMRQLPKPGMNVTARTTADPASLQASIRSAVAKVDRDQPISFFTTVASALSQNLSVQRIVAGLTACFAGIALVLAAVGLYSVVAHAVTQRTSEIGIRMALGARPVQVLKLVMGGGLKLVAIGLVIGLAGAAGVAHAIRSQLSNVQPLDPLVYASVAVFFGLVAALACLVPSWRASRIDPLAAIGDRRVRT